MKRIIIALVFLTAALANAEAHRGYRSHATVSVQTFYDELSPFGDWILTPEYGYAWRPYLDDPEGFRPYATRGEWAYTDLGWTWVSDYRWGWATFHYGRWFLDDSLGWMWIPGSEWAPAWVTWGSYDDCWAWAPMGPAVQVSFNLHWRAPHSWWTFVPRRHFCTSNWYDYRYSQPVQINQITVINNIYNDHRYSDRNNHWFRGPRVNDVERHANARVRKVDITHTDRPGRHDTPINRTYVNRPEVKNERGNPRPVTVQRTETPRVTPRSGEVKRSSEASEKARESARNTTTRETVKRSAPAQRTAERTSQERTRSERTSVREKPGNH
jgi:hypothetical protein